MCAVFFFAGYLANTLLTPKQVHALRNIADLHQVDAVVQKGKVVFRREP